MSQDKLQRAKLTPYPAGTGGKTNQPDNKKAIELDFNPETLTLKVSSGEKKDKGRHHNQQVQNAGASKATLSFDCFFDATRPRERDAATAQEGPDVEKRDIRRRTKPIADLLQVEGSGNDQAPRRVQFSWGSFQFNGVISQYQEVFDYFSPEGVPLRSKISLTLDEQDYQYELKAADTDQRRRAIEQASAGGREQARAAGQDRLLPGAINQSTSAGFSLEASLQANLALDVELGLSVGLQAEAQFGFSVNGGLNLSAEASIDLFGSAAITANLAPARGGLVGAAVPSTAAGLPMPSSSGAVDSKALGVDLGRAPVALPSPSPTLGGRAQPALPWAPDAAAPGSRAADLAAVVMGRRAQGLSAPRDRGAAGAPAIPIRGHAPLKPRRFLNPPLPVFASSSSVAARGAEAGPIRPQLPSGQRSCQGNAACGCGCCSGSSSPVFRQP